jgi:hypothetical protein
MHTEEKMKKHKAEGKVRKKGTEKGRANKGK